MIDNFALALTHGLLALVAWRLLWRADLDEDGASPIASSRWGPGATADEETPGA